MATNTFIKPSVVARMALANLYAQSVMLPLVHRDYENDFVQGAGDTVTIRKPATFTAQDFNESVGTQAQNITETSVAVTLQYHKDITINIGAKERALDIKDLQEQVITPVMEAHALAVDQAILLEKNNIVQEVGVNGGATQGINGTNSWDWDNPRVLIDAKRVLNHRNVPQSERYVVVGPTTAAKWEGDDLLTKASDRGDIRGRTDAYLGSRLFGFEPYETTNISEADEVSLAFHRTAIAFVSRPLMLPEGAARSEYAQYKGVGVRVVWDYNSQYKRDEISFDLIFGTKTLDANRATVIYGSAS